MCWLVSLGWRLEAIAIRMEAMAIMRLEAIAFNLGWRPSLLNGKNRYWVGHLIEVLAWVVVTHCGCFLGF